MLRPAAGAHFQGAVPCPFCRRHAFRSSTSFRLAVGGVYQIGFAVHDGNIDGRGHHVSYVKTLGFGVKADIQAVKLN
jgi:hypothetical protein